MDYTENINQGNGNENVTVKQFLSLYVKRYYWSFMKKLGRAVRT